MKTIMVVALTLVGVLSGSPCNDAADAATANTGLVGVFIPECDSDGAYLPRQCHASTGYCWCVDTEGQEILGTSQRTWETTTVIDCSAVPACLLSAHTIRLTGEAGSYVPQCHSDGSYSSEQCNTDECWCVVSDGTEITGTRVSATSQTKFDCDSVPYCLLGRLDATRSGTVGSFLVQCNADGSFASRQFRASSGQSWCVDSTGIEVEGTRESITDTSSFDCDNLPPCFTEAHVANTAGLTGLFKPACLANGAYAPRQCHASTGYCFCSDSQGLEVLGSRRSAGDELVDCENLPECFSAAHVARNRNLIGNFIPSCNEDGTFSREQCHRSTGYCWCSNQSGDEISGTRRGPGQTHLDCSNLPQCLRTLAATGGKRKFGAYLPQCDDSGYFSPRQCHGSTGYCWCVDPESGRELSGTRRSPGGGQFLDCAAELENQEDSDSDSESDEKGHYGKHLPIALVSGALALGTVVAVVVAFRSRRRIVAGGTVVVHEMARGDTTVCEDRDSVPFVTKP